MPMPSANPERMIEVAPRLGFVDERPPTAACNVDRAMAAKAGPASPFTGSR